MRPDKKKKGRGRYAGKSEATQGKDISKAEDSKENGSSEKTEPSPSNDSDKTKPAVDDTPPPTKDSNDSAPAPVLRRETDALKETNKPWKRQIFSNWKEYDKPIVSEMDDEEHFHDFASLMQRDISGDSYFKFKHERLWENDSNNFNKDLFNLNLKQLSAGLDCIPFYERLSIPTHLFSEHEVQRMNNVAKKQETVYDKLLKSVDISKVDIIHASNDKSNFKENNEPQDVDELNLKSLESKTQPQGVDELNLKSLVSKTQPQDEYCMDMENVWATEDTGTCFNENVWNESKVSDSIVTETQPSVNEITAVESKDNKLDESKLNSNKIDNIPRQEVVSNIVHVENKSCPSEKQEIKETSCKASGASVSSGEVEKVEQESRNSSVPSKSDQSDDQTETIAPPSSPKEIRSVFGNSSLGPEAKRTPRSRRVKDKSQSKVSKPVEEDDILDSLLSLKEPSISAIDSKRDTEERDGEADNLTNDLKSIVIHEKKENLEAWLDSMLDD